MIAHQFSLFGIKDTKPKVKVPISAARIKQVKELIARRDGKNAAIALRDVRESLERFEARLK